MAISFLLSRWRTKRSSIRLKIPFWITYTFDTDKKLEIRDRIVNDPELCYTAVLHHSYKEFCDLTLAKPVGRKRFVEYIRNEYNLDVKNEGIYLADGRHTTRDRYVKTGM